LTRSVGNPGEMNDDTRMSDADIEQLLAGKPRPGGDELPGVRQFFQEVKTRYAVDPPAAVREAHLARIVSAARLQADQTSPGAAASIAPGAARAAAPATSGGGAEKPPWRRKVVLSSLFGSITAKILVGVVAATAATGGLAAAGALPRPVQNAVASAAEGVGVSLPNPQASASAAAAAQAQAQKVASTVNSLVQQVTTGAQHAGAVTPTALKTTSTCTQNVSAIASDLSGAVGAADNVGLAQSLAARATALAQESVGCGLPATAAAAAATGTTHTDGPSTGSQAIAGAIQQCSGTLKSTIETLVEAAIAAKTSAQAGGLTDDAKAVAEAAQTCAEGVAGALTSLEPTLSATTPATSGTRGLQSLIPTVPATGLPAAHPATTPASGSKATIPVPTITSPADWLKLLSQLPTSLPSGSASSGSTSGSGAWSGMTGDWTSSGTWSPYSTGSPQSTGSSDNTSSSTSPTSGTGYHH
jgi:hypothetical protein